MSTADKTRQQLLASMRKSKSGPAKKAPAAGKKATAKRSASAPRKKAAASTARSRKTAAPAGTYTGPAARPVIAGDAYQSPGRVWPD